MCLCRARRVECRTILSGRAPGQTKNIGGSGPRYAAGNGLPGREALKACFHKDGWIEATFLQKIGLEGLDYVTDGDW